MKKILLGSLLALVISVQAQAQDALVVPSCGSPGIAYTAGQMQMPTVDTNGKLCLNNSGSATPSGPAGGSLKGTYPNPSLADVNSIGTSLVIGAGSAITSSGPGGAIASLAYVNPGTGVLTALGNTAGGSGGFALVGATPPTGTAGGSLAGTYPNPSLSSVVTAGGPTGSTTVAPIITYSAEGRLTTVSSATITPAVGSITGLGTGAATALGVNVGTAGAFVVNGGALGTPSSGTLTSVTGLPVSTGLTGAGTGVLTALGVNVGSAGAFITNGGALGTPSSGTLTNATGLPVSSLAGVGPLINSLSSPVTMNNSSNFFDGPIVAQGTVGTWFVSGYVTLTPDATGSNMSCKLWDGTNTPIATNAPSIAAGNQYVIPLSGVVVGPAGSMRISCKDSSGTTGIIVANGSGLSKDSTLTAFRIN